MLSSTCQRVATLQFDSCAEKDSLGRHWTSVFVCGCASNAPRFAQGQPNGYFQMKELDGTIGPSVLSSTCQHVATLQFVSRQIRSLFRTASLFSTKVTFCSFVSVFLWMRKQQPRFAQGQPKGYSKWRFFKNAGSCIRAQGGAQDILYVYSYTHNISN